MKYYPQIVFDLVHPLYVQESLDFTPKHFVAKRFKLIPIRYT